MDQGQKESSPSYLSTPPSTTTPPTYLIPSIPQPPEPSRRSSDPGLPTPPTLATPAPIPSPSTTTLSTGRKKHVSAACSNCRAAHAACDTVRPCERCVRLGKQESCMTPVHRKRGRKSVKRQGKGNQSPKERMKSPEMGQRRSSMSPMMMGTHALRGERNRVKLPAYDDILTLRETGPRDRRDSIQSRDHGDTPKSTPILPHTVPSRKRSLNAMHTSDGEYHYPPTDRFSSYSTSPPQTRYHWTFCETRPREGDEMGPMTLNPFDPKPLREALGPQHEEYHEPDVDQERQERDIWYIDLKTHRILHDNRHIYHLIHPVDHSYFTSLIHSPPSPTEQSIRIHIAGKTGNSQSLKNVTLLKKTELVATLEVRDFWVGEEMSGLGFDGMLEGLREGKRRRV